MVSQSIVLMAQERGYHDAEHWGKWNGFDVYEPIFTDDELHIIGPPLMILAKENTVRWSTPEEAYKMLDQ